MPEPHKTTTDKIKKAICKECPDARYTVGYRRVLICTDDCWIRKAIKNSEKK